MADDVWNSPAGDGPSEAPDAPRPLGDTPGDASDPTAVAKAVLADLRAHALGYATSGLAYLVTAFGLIFVAVAILGVCMLPGLATEDETLLVVGGIIGMSGYMGLIFGFSFVVFPLMVASATRAIDRQRRGGAELGFGSLFDAMRHRWTTVIAFYLAVQGLTFVGALLLYLPAFVAIVVGAFAFPIVVLEDVAVGRALGIAWRHVKANAVWHLATWASMLVAFVLLELTIVGLILVFPLLAAWQLYAYRVAFGEAGAVAWAERNPV